MYLRVSRRACEYHKEKRPRDCVVGMKEFPPFRLDLVNQCLWRRGDETDGERILLAPTAFAMLRYLVEHAGRLVTQDELLDALWPDTFVQPEVLKSHIREIRSALCDDAKNARFIETLPRRGYQFIASVTDDSCKTNLEADSPASRLVGRNTELEQLRGSLRRALHGERQLVFVTGEPGIGKTALVDEFQRQAVRAQSGYDEQHNISQRDDQRNSQDPRSGRVPHIAGVVVHVPSLKAGCGLFNWAGGRTQFRRPCETLYSSETMHRHGINGAWNCVGWRKGYAARSA